MANGYEPRKAPEVDHPPQQAKSDDIHKALEHVNDLLTLAQTEIKQIQHRLAAIQRVIGSV